MLNHIVIMGRLTRDPELRRTGTGIAVTSFSVAVERDFGSRDGGEKETDFIDCVAWRHNGEFISKYFSKGSMIVVSGRLQIRGWTDKDGNKRRTAEVVADSVYFGDSKRNNSQTGGDPGNGYGVPQNGGFNGYTAPAVPQGGNSYSGNVYGGGNNAYGMPTPGYGGYSAPTSPVSDFAMLEDDDAQLPF